MVRAEFGGVLMASTTVHWDERPGSAPVRVKDPSVPTNPCISPPDVQDVRRVLSRLRTWEPVDWDEVYDDLDTVLGDEVSHHAAGTSVGSPLPEYDALEGLAERFRPALIQLVTRGLRNGAHRKHRDIAVLIEQAQGLIPEELPADAWQAVVLLRKLARVTLGLAERLEDTGIAKGLVEC
ncbi:DUF6415 family natural product biosynthesis protein [Streptomyces noursei]|uniref:DUF6415 family natural product biosynthesis protein n=1 Tax=Streptomyces noursei TaxID=1971 RepID=UPI000F573FDD|nr:DUF6415 family natural product biosynthesis protein [Streptomyces noursei]UWS75254.1 DUF6415 family natural product biosynthesis protein [Streptomyces noursei]